MSSHFIASFVPTAMPVVAGEVASRVQVAVSRPRRAIVIVLPTPPSPVVLAVPNAERARDVAEAVRRAVRGAGLDRQRAAQLCGRGRERRRTRVTTLRDRERLAVRAGARGAAELDLVGRERGGRGT